MKVLNEWHIPEVPMQSPTMIAGLHKIATLPWLHFVALPQRVPAFCYRRWGRPAINVIDRVPPLIASSSIGNTSRDGSQTHDPVTASADQQDAIKMSHYAAAI